MKIMQHALYTIPHIRQAVTNNFGCETVPALIFDEPASSLPNSMQEYFNSSYEVFLQRLEEFRQMKRTLTPQEEKEFTFMLEALISAKSILESK